MGSRNEKRMGGRADTEMDGLPVRAFKVRSDLCHAAQITQENILELATWCGGRLFDDINPLDDNDRKKGLKVPTVNGIVSAFDGYYLIKNSAGRFEVNSAEYFENKFEAL
jgi:hypothetical protein